MGKLLMMILSESFVAWLRGATAACCCALRVAGTAPAYRARAPPGAGAEAPPRRPPAPPRLVFLLDALRLVMS